MTEEKQEKGLARITNYLESDMVKARFKEVLGNRNAGAYITSVLIAVKDSKQLQECSPASIYTSAARAATLRLSVDPSTGQAYMVPYNGRATLIVGYKGLYDMAVRTNKYRYINVGPIYEGMNVEENPITGFHSITRDGDLNKDNIIGWIGSFEMMNGFGKTFYMTHDEIHDHAKAYSPGYDNPKGPWKKETRKMERKTVMRLLLRKWGYLDPSDVQTLENIESDPEAIEGIYAPEIPEYDENAEEVHKETKSKEQMLKELGGYG
jgi:recombination protein RecT